MSDSFSRRGIMTGTPVPSSDRENATQGAGTLTVEHWSPEQMDAYLSKYKKPEKKEVSENMAIEVTKEQYLELRMGGMNRAQAQRHLGLNPATFYAFLTQWQIKDRDAEDQLLESMREGQAVAKGFQAEIAVSATREPNTRSAQNTQAYVDKSEGSDTAYVLVKIPVVPADWPEQLKSGAVQNVDRDSLIRIGVACLQNAAAWAHRELVDILGDDGSAAVPLQSFMERKCAL